jgi:hypothetical protein
MSCPVSCYATCRVLDPVASNLLFVSGVQVLSLVSCSLVVGGANSQEGSIGCQVEVSLISSVSEIFCSLPHAISQ